MAPSVLPAMKTNPKYIFFTDFDGTITLQDSNDFMTDNIGFGQEKRRQGNADTLQGKVTFRESFTDMMESVTMPYQQCIDYLVKNIELDPYFKDFFQWSLEQNIPVVVLSSGMEPIIKALLAALVGENAEKMMVIGNDVRARPEMSIDQIGGWELVFHDESGYGHDKSRTIRPYADLPSNERPTLFYAGDGVSDLSAARETDLLFAKKGEDLLSFCVEKDIPFTFFEDWRSITKKVKEIVAGETTVQDAAAEGYRLFKAGEAGIDPNLK